MLPPTSVLPSIRSLPDTPISVLLGHISRLRELYTPSIRGSRRKISNTKVGFWPERVQHTLHEDAFEKAYVIQWLTSLLSRSHALEDHDSEELIQETASLLALCSGTAGAGTFTRNIHLPHLFSHDIVLSLKDIPLENSDYSSVGAQTWGGAVVLAEDLASEPNRFALDTATRVLELGAGTGLVSLAAAMVQDCMHVESTVVATDFYPAVLTNLSENISENIPSSRKTSVKVLTAALDWQHPKWEAPLDQPFDVVLGADIIYEAEHARWIKSCLEHLLKKPEPGSSPPSFHLVIPIRRTHTEESNTVHQVFSVERHSGQRLELSIVEERTIVCEADDGQGDEDVEYSYFKIGWV